MSKLAKQSRSAIKWKGIYVYALIVVYLKNSNNITAKINMGVASLNPKHINGLSVDRLTADSELLQLPEKQGYPDDISLCFVMLELGYQINTQLLGVNKRLYPLSCHSLFEYYKISSYDISKGLKLSLNDKRKGWFGL